MRNASQSRLYPSSVLLPLIDALEDRGFPLRACLKGTRLLPADILGTARISLTDILTVYANAAELVPDPGFAFQAGRRYHLSSYGVYGFAVLSAPTFGQALQLIFDYGGAVEVPLGATFLRDERTVVFAVTPDLLPREFAGLSRFVIDMQAGQMLTACRDLLGPDFTFHSLSLGYDLDPGLGGHIDLPGCQVIYGATDTSITIGAGDLDRRIQLRNAATHALLTQLCDNMLRDLKDNIGLDGALRAILIANQGHPIPLADICAQLGTTERSLRRKLAQKGTSWREIAEDVRMGFAQKYLRDSALDAATIAEALGFSDSSSFRRALRRWQAADPGAARGGIATMMARALRRLG